MKGLKDMKIVGDRLRARLRAQLVFMPFMPFMSFMVIVGSFVALRAQKPASPNQAPVFKTKVDVVQLDVSVLDKHRQPVRGLAAKDFTILEDGKPQPIVGFSTFDVGATPPPATGWMREVPPDVTTNELKESRLFVIVMDDALIPQDAFSVKASREIAKSIVDKLGPDDLTAVIFTGDNRKTQDFTSDKTKLRAALNRFNPGLAGYTFGLDSIPRPDSPVTGMGEVPVSTVNPDSGFYKGSIRTLINVADYLIAVPNRRKALFWVSPGVPFDLQETAPKKAGQTIPGTTIMIPISDTEVMLELARDTQEIFRRAQLANVAIYPIDPTGLGGLRVYLTSRLPGLDYPGPMARKADAMFDFLAEAAAATGGRAVMNTNDFEPGITEIFEENESYYLIGFEPLNTAADGKLRKLEVNVNRPGVDVRTRSSYYAPEPEQPADKKTAKNALTPEAEALAKAMGGILPMAGMPMRVAVAPFAVPGQRLSTVAVVLGITQPIPAAAANGRITETTELLTSAFTPEGDPRGAQKHKASVVLRAGSNGDASYEVLARIDLPPGRYSLRLAAHNGTSGRDGSVFADVTVPDYSNIPFSASPVVLSATPGRASAPKDLLSPLLPLVPTAERAFSRTDRVTSFLRLYQSGQKAVEGVRLAIRLKDASDQLKTDESQAIGVDRFAAVERPDVAATPATARGGTVPPQPTLRGLPTPTPQATDQFANYALRTAGIKYAIPLSGLAPGPYLLTFEATLGQTTVRRDVRFEVR